MQEKVGARGGTGFVDGSGEATAVGKAAGPPGTSTGAASKTPATSTAITATFDVFERMEACEREGTLRHADRSAYDGDRVRHGFVFEGLRGARLVEAIKHGMDDGFHELAVQADEFQGNHQDGAPMPGTGDVVQVPKSRSLRELLESDGMSSLAERALWLEISSARTVGRRR